MTHTQKAARLLELHHAASPVILINAWDAASARIVEHAGFPAVATTSAGVANALGYADGQHVPWSEMAQAIERIAEVVQVPVTADIEAGFSSDAQQLEAVIEQVIEAGAVGVNLEDSVPGHPSHSILFSIADQTARIQTVRRIGEKLKIHLLINARTDAYWRQGVSREEALRDTLERGHAYLKAGADCIFVPGLRDPGQISTVVGEWKSPINILAGPGVPSIPELTRLGVKRISYGSGPMRSTMGLLRRMCDEAKATGTYNAMTEGAVSHAEINELMKK
ncbi:MAG: isocitrate lyase/phosphoenolpyruvate mutase family protein [Acidobacteriia bacterium]|nr:isocitrate lyase/phosphoenolpyruvate mutase family protein [Terriglobia bacterium]